MSSVIELNNKPIITVAIKLWSLKYVNTVNTSGGMVLVSIWSSFSFVIRMFFANVFLKKIIR